MHSTTNTQTAEIPLDGIAGLRENWKTDIVSGFILFLIALPLSLGIAMASGVPPMAGIIAAVVGGLLVSQISGSFVTINGPAAGLIVVILAAVEKLGGGQTGYQCMLAAVVISGALLFVLGLLKAGELGAFFPTSVVHGMLAAIGVIIMAKQIHVMLGVAPTAKDPLGLLAEIPHSILNLNPEIAVIGLVSLIILIAHAAIKNSLWKKIPAPLIVMAVALLMGMLFDLDHKHSYLVGSARYVLDPHKYLVVLPENVLSGIAHPDFSQITSSTFWFAVLSITMVQGIETLLSCAAVDRLDPYKRQANLSRDMSAVGIGSLVSASIGGLPIIAEIVRSTANVNNGARTRYSNFFHGLFMLIFVLVGAAVIDKIPLAALAALLVVTGFRLASPRIFKETYEIGPEQIFLFAVTLVATLATDLMIGVGIGIATKFVLHLYNGAPIKAIFKAPISIEEEIDGLISIQIADAAIFTNYLSIKQKLDKLPPGRRLRLDLRFVKLIDHTVMDKLHEYAINYAKTGGQLSIAGLEDHEPTSVHPLASRRRR